jgi:hypothetical protein
MSVTPGPGLTSTVTTGGTAVNAVGPGANGGYITNPLLGVDQGVATAEPLFVDPVTSAILGGYGTTIALQPGQTYNIVSGSTNPVTVNAATGGHRFTVVVY